jgi:hypothetical protein
MGESSTHIGVYGNSPSGSGVQGNSSTNAGVSGFSTSGSGVYGQSSSSVGLFGLSLFSVGGSNSIGVLGVGATYDFDAQGPGVNYGATSSIRWKRNIVNIPSALEKLNSLRGVYFDWDEAHGGKHDIGFIAEEVGKVIPEIVVYEENGVDASGMDYSKMTPLLVEATNAMRREYQEKFEAQEREIAFMKKEISKLKELVSQLSSQNQ